MTTKAFPMSIRTGFITGVGSVRDAGKVGDLSARYGAVFQAVCSM